MIHFVARLGSVLALLEPPSFQLYDVEVSGILFEERLLRSLRALRPQTSQRRFWQRYNSEAA